MGQSRLHLKQNVPPRLSPKGQSFFIHRSMPGVSQRMLELLGLSYPNVRRKLKGLGIRGQSGSVKFEPQTTGNVPTLLSLLVLFVRLTFCMIDSITMTLQLPESIRFGRIELSLLLSDCILLQLRVWSGRGEFWLAKLAIVIGLELVKTPLVVPPPN